jgi:hypothetical protein
MILTRRDERKRPNAKEIKERKLIGWKNARPHPDLLPQEKEQQLGVPNVMDNRPANPIAGFSVRRRTILLLLGEKAGMRED